LGSPEGYSTFYEFLEAPAGGFGPLELPKTNTPYTNIPSPRPNSNFRANMAANRPSLVVDSIVVPGAQHPFTRHPKKLLPKFDPDNDVSPKYHIKQFMLSLRIMEVENEDVCRLFLYTFVGKASIWSFVFL
jgi:hypothetical protein